MKMSDGEKSGKSFSEASAGTRPKKLQRRSSIQKIIHMCNQSYQVFPHVFLWVQIYIDKTTLQTDITKLIPLLRSLLALRHGVYLSIALLSAELAYCLLATLSLLLPSASALFFFVCIAVLSAIAFQIFEVALQVNNKITASYFLTNKKLS